jgi:hypothetical protein
MTNKATKLARIIARAKRMRHVKNGFVTCDVCGNPASMSASLALGWTGCAVCVFGESDAFDEEDLIPVGVPLVDTLEEVRGR